MTNTFLSTISLLTYTLLLNYFFSSWGKASPFKTKYHLLILAIIVLNISLPHLLSSVPIPYANFVLTIFLIVIVAKKYAIPYIEIVFWTIVLLAINFICELSALYIAQSIFPDNLEYMRNPHFIILTTTLTSLLDIVIIISIKLFIFSNDSPRPPINVASLLALASFPILSIIILASLLLERVDIGFNKHLRDILIILGIVGMNICVLLLYNNLSNYLRQLSQITLQNKILEAQTKYVEEIERHHTSIKKIQHDLKNYSIVAIGLINQNKLDQAKDFLQASIQLPESQQQIYSSDETLNYLLNEKVTLAKSHHIHTQVEVFLSENVTVDHNILAIIVGNLMDNAIEACCRMKEKERSISLVIKQMDNNLLIDISNTFDPAEKLSRKSRQLEGIGLGNVSRLVETFGGIFKHWTNERQFHASVILFNVYSTKS